jgi:hypothetical protein
MNEMIKGGWIIENPEGGGEGWEVADCYGIAATVHGEPGSLDHRQNAAAVESVPVMLDLLQRLALAEPGEMANLTGEAEALLARIERGEFLTEDCD